MSVTDIISNSLNDLIRIKMESVINIFSKELNKELDVDSSKIIDIWNKIIPEIKINNIKTKSIDSGESCSFILLKGKNKDSKCPNKVCKKSKQGYCSLHVKLEEEGGNEKDNKKVEKEICNFIFKKGQKTGTRCDRNISKKSKLGYCCLHYKEELELASNGVTIKEDKKQKQKLEFSSDESDNESDDDTKSKFSKLITNKKMNTSDSESSESSDSDDDRLKHKISSKQTFAINYETDSE